MFYLSLSVYLYIYLPLYVSIYLSIYLSNNLSLSLTIYLVLCPVYVSLTISPNPCISLFLCLSLCLSLSIPPYLSTYLSVCPSIYLSRYISISLFLSLSLSVSPSPSLTLSQTLSQLPKLVRDRQVSTLLACECASCHRGLPLFHISTSKSGPRPSVLNTIDLRTCFAPQRCAPFEYLNVQKEKVLRWIPHPAALAGLLFDPPEPPNIGKTQCFTTFLPFRAL